MDKSDLEKASASQEEAQALVDEKLNNKLKISRILKKIGVLGKFSILASTRPTLIRAPQDVAVIAVLDL